MQKHESPDVWWDDYGWWGITFAKIYERLADIFKGANALKVTRDDVCKSRVIAGARSVRIPKR